MAGPAANAEPQIAVDESDGRRLRLRGRWTLRFAGHIAEALRGAPEDAQTIDARHIDRLDSAGVLLLLRFLRRRGLDRRPRPVVRIDRGPKHASGVGADGTGRAGQWIEPSRVSPPQAVSYERRRARTAKPCGPGCRCYSQACAKMHAPTGVRRIVNSRRRR